MKILNCWVGVNMRERVAKESRQINGIPRSAINLNMGGLSCETQGTLTKPLRIQFLFF